MLEHFVFSSRIYFSSSLRWITIPYFRERFLFLCLSISLSFLDIVIVLVFIMPFPARFLKQNTQPDFTKRCCIFAFKGVRGIFPLQAKTFRFPWEERWMFVRLRIYAGSACYSCANCPQGVCVLCELRRASYNT